MYVLYVVQLGRYKSLLFRTSLLHFLVKISQKGAQMSQVLVFNLKQPMNNSQ